MSSNTNPQGAMVGDLIMWTANNSGFNFGKIISFMKDGRPTVRPIREPWFQEHAYVEDLDQWVTTNWGSQTNEKGEKGYYGSKKVKVDIQHPLGYSGGQQSGYSWMVIAYGPDNPKSRTITEPHPIAKAKQQFAELETKVQGAF